MDGHDNVIEISDDSDGHAGNESPLSDGSVYSSAPYYEVQVHPILSDSEEESLEADKEKIADKKGKQQCVAETLKGSHKKDDDDGAGPSKNRWPRTSVASRVIAFPRYPSSK